MTGTGSRATQPPETAAGGRAQRLSGSAEFKMAMEHLKATDIRLRSIIADLGPIRLKPDRNLFESLVESILSQQLASAAARSVIARFRSIYSPGGITPAAVLKTRRRRLRLAGVSPQKISYLMDLSARVSGGDLELEALRDMSDGEVMDTLDPVRGIGPWTVQMLLIFALQRPDVLPVADLGIRKAIQRIYSLRTLPSASTIEKIARPWHPYCTVASLYLWRSKDGE